MTGTVEIIKYHRRWLPIPEGWELAADLKGCHHGVYAVLIRKVSSDE